MRTIPAIILLVTAMTSCQPKKDDPAILKQILVDYFDGVKNRDLAKLNSVTTSDFVLFENGMIWTNDSIVKPNKRLKSFKGEWTFDNVKINIDESSGDVVYFDHGEFVYNDSIKVSKDWLESATFRKIDGQWKMNFLHSTVRR